MNGWNGFNLGGLNTGPGGWPGMPMPAPAMAMPAAARGFSMPTGQTPTGWVGGNFMSPDKGAKPGGWGGIDGLGANIDTLRLGVGGLSTIAGLWNGFQQNKLAKASFNHQRGLLDTNLANQIKAYNLSVDDKFRSRAVVEGRSNAERDADISRWSARDERPGRSRN